MLNFDEVRAKEIVVLRNAGFSFAELGKHFALSRQRVHQIFLQYSQYGCRQHNYVYPNIEKWLNENNYTVKKLAGISGINYNTLINSLLGKNNLSAPSVIKLIKVTGLSYEKITFKRF